MIKLAPDISSGTIVGSITSPDFSGPTTIDEHGNRRSLPSTLGWRAPTPDTPYWLTQVIRR